MATAELFGSGQSIGDNDLNFSSNWEIIKYNNELFEFDFVVEFVRQWLCIFATIGLSYLFLRSICNLKRTQ